MCGRYKLGTEPSLVALWMEAQSDIPEQWELLNPDDIRPTDEIPVCILVEQDGARQLQLARWGWQPIGVPRLVINARAETLASSRVWSPLLKAEPGAAGGRCLIPASSYYEWPEKVRHVIAPPDGGLIAQTGWAGPQDRQQTEAAGFDAHLAKPIPLDRVLKLLEAHQDRPAAR